MKNQSRTGKSKKLLAIATLVLAFLLSFYPSYGRLDLNPDPLVRQSRKISAVLSETIALHEGSLNLAEPISVMLEVEPEYFLRAEQSRSEYSQVGDFKTLPVIHGYSARLRPAQIRALLDSEVVEYVTLDMPVNATASNNAQDKNVFLQTIGADQARDAGYDGSGVVVAVFDSGLAGHQDIDVPRIVVSVDFTSGDADVLKRNEDNDVYGHGSAVASVIGGNGKKSQGKYQGVAPNVKFVDVKVLKDDGSGQTSSLIKAISWVIENRKKYDIRAANFSLGHPPVESYQNDPLCKAIEELVKSGVVTMVSAGNLGKWKGNVKVWGAINSPGNDPYVITVSPINTRGTAEHSDDVATSYGSRGPTYKDNLFKPDLCAPGNNVPAAMRSSSVLSKNNPQIRLDSNYVKLSGASVATPHVTGTVALMLQANPSLTPSAAKTILQFTAIKLTQPNILEQGSGLVNALTAVQLAKALNLTTLKLNGAVSWKWQLNGADVWAGGAVVLGPRILYSSLLDLQKVSAVKPIWGDGYVWSGLINQSAASTTFVPTGIIWADGIVWADGLPAVPDGIVWSDGLVWSDRALRADGIIWAESLIRADGILWAESINTTALVSADPN